MNENHDLLPDLMHEEFEVQMRGYSRRQVDEFVARRTGEIRDLEQRLSRSLDEIEHLRREVTVMRQQGLSGKPAHEEVSERIAQILKLADDEARAQRNKASDEIAKQRSDAQTETDRVRTDAREQAERMLTAAQEQAERTIAASRTEADKTRNAARTEADRLSADARKKSEAATASAKAQAKKILDEATARATAIHDGAERRLNMLSTRHSDVIRRLNDLLDGVSGLVAAENARPSLEDEVELVVAKTLAAQAAVPDSTREQEILTDPKPTRPVSTREPLAREPSVRAVGTPPRSQSVAPTSVTGREPIPMGGDATATTGAVRGPKPTADPLATAAAAPAPPPNPATRVSEAGAPPAHTGSIDPDEATEGVRLMPS